MKITDFSVDRPVSITMLVMIVMIVGGIALSRLGMDMLPEIDYPTLSVMVRYPGAPSEEIETMVAKPYEGALAAVNKVTSIQSVSLEDVCYLMVEFEWGTDLDAAAADIREAVAMIEPYMPPDVEDPFVIKFDLSQMPQAFYAVTGMEDTIALRELMTDNVQPRLERLDGIAQAPFFGGKVEEVQVLLDRTALQGSGVSPDHVVMALGAQNLNLPAGRQIRRDQELLLRTVGMFDDLRDIESVAVGMSTTTMTPIRLGSVAEVKRTTKDARNLIRANGMEAVMMLIMKSSGANPLQVRRDFQDKLEELSEILPPEIRFSKLFDMGQIIARMGRSVTENGILGIILAVGVMYLFLRAIRPTLAIAAAIPLSLLATCIPIFAVGETLNLMTMGGLVLGIGMLVDNAVVVIESIYRHIEEGKPRHEAAKAGAGEVGMAITASTLTTMVVFLPILFSKGLAGQLATGLAITVAAALFSSLFVALTIVPMLASVFFTSKVEGAILHDGKRFSRFKQRYKRILGFSLRHRFLTLVALGAMTLFTLPLVYFVGTEFMPETSRPVLMAKVSFPVGTPLVHTSEAAVQVETAMAQFADVESVGAQLGVDENDTGGGMSESNPAGPHEGIIFARLKDSKDRIYKSNVDLQAQMREVIPEIEGMEFQFMDMGGMGGSTHPIEIKLTGADFEVLTEWADLIAAEISHIEGIVDVDTSMREAKPEQHIVIDRDKAATYGLTVGQVAMTLKTATLGTVATRYRESGDEIDVRVQYAEPFRDTQQALEQVLIPVPMGGTIPLGQIAHIEDGIGPVKIIRDDQSRLVTVFANLEGVNLGDAMRQVQKALDPIEDQLPQGYMLDFGGQYEEMMDAFGQLLLALILAVVMVYMVMASQFESFTHPFAIMFTMPLALLGVIWVFLLTRTTLSVPTFLGVIMLAGIVVNNGIVLIDYVNQLRARGYDIITATIEGSATRLRPVLITSLTTVGAMVPMAISQREGAEMMTPLGLTIIGGLLAATFLTLVVVPVVYTLLDTVASWFSRLANRILHGPEDQAPVPGPAK